MMSHAYGIRTGMRRMDGAVASAERAASAFDGLPADVSHGMVLAAFKRAAPYVGVPPRIVHLVDQLMCWSRAVDWTKGERPIVFPSNEKLTHVLGVGVRQLQKMLSAAGSLGLVVHRDSANGKRMGVRGPDGRLLYAYGIDLSPLGLRYEEFVDAGKKGMETDRRVSLLRLRLASARRRIRALSQCMPHRSSSGIAVDQGMNEALIVTNEMRRVRDETRLSIAVTELEGIAARLADAVANACDASGSEGATPISSPSSELDDTPIRTTIQLETAEAEYRAPHPSKPIDTSYDVRRNEPQTEVEEDLVKNNVDASFITHMAADIMDLKHEAPSWGRLVHAAERLTGQLAIRQGVWREACAVMGQKAAAASVFVVMRKHMLGEVESPGAYLRGMNRRAAAGRLNLARSCIGLNKATPSESGRFVPSGPSLRSIGSMMASALRATQTSMVRHGETEYATAYPKARELRRTATSA